MTKPEFAAKTNKRGVAICLETHPEVFYRILRNGSGTKKHGPPCDSCREKAIKEGVREIKKKRQPWLRKPKKTMPLLEGL